MFSLLLDREKSWTSPLDQVFDMLSDRILLGSPPHRVNQVLFLRDNLADWDTPPLSMGIELNASPLVILDLILPDEAHFSA